jgi:RNA polymerase sigma factor (sigma-70 family)
VSVLAPTIHPLMQPAATRLMAAAAPCGEDGAVAALTRGLAAGEEESFRAFHAAYFDRLLRYLLVVARGDEELAREALQETFLRVVRHARRFEDEAAFWRWLTLLARCAARDGGRKRRRYIRLLADYARSLLGLNSAGPPALEPDEPLREALTRGVAELDSSDRRLIEGKYLRGASVRDLARDTGLTEKAVESRLLRARRQLRATLFRRLRDENAS